MQKYMTVYLRNSALWIQNVDFTKTINIFIIHQNILYKSRSKIIVIKIIRFSHVSRVFVIIYLFIPGSPN